MGVLFTKFVFHYYYFELMQLNITLLTKALRVALTFMRVFISDQEERSRSVEAFRRAQKDVLVATDVASKGLDFADVQHVINYDMPDDVENYGVYYF